MWLIDNHKNAVQRGVSLVIAILVILLLMIVLLATLVALQSRQLFKSKAAASPTMSLVPDTATVAPGDQIDEIIQIDTAQPIGTVRAIISYDATRLSLAGIDTGTSAFLVKVEETNRNGAVRIIRANPTGLTGKIVVAILHFTANSGVSGQATIAFTAGTEADSSDAPNNNILTTTNGASVTIKSATQSTPAPAGTKSRSSSLLFPDTASSSANLAAPSLQPTSVATPTAKRQAGTSNTILNTFGAAFQKLFH